MTLNKKLIALLLMGGVGLAGCGSDDHDEGAEHAASAGSHAGSMKASHASGAKAGGHGAAHWTYAGEGGPHMWGELSDEFATCGTGKSQSPIDISPVTITELPPIEVDYKSTVLDVTNNGHTIKVSYAPGSSITVGGKKYDLLQFHFHSPSEHTVGGKSFAMVAHLVHKAADGQLGVIGVLMEEGASNFLVQKVWKNMPKEEGGHKTVEKVKLNVAQLLPKDMSYYNYSGSLTTPPCSEGVNWMVLRNPVTVSAAQVQQFTELFPLSVRPVQPLNGRVVKTSN